MGRQEVGERLLMRDNHTSALQVVEREEWKKASKIFFNYKL